MLTEAQPREQVQDEHHNLLKTLWRETPEKKNPGTNELGCKVKVTFQRVGRTPRVPVPGQREGTGKQTPGHLGTWKKAYCRSRVHPQSLHGLHSTQGDVMDGLHLEMWDNLERSSTGQNGPYLVTRKRREKKTGS